MNTRSYFSTFQDPCTPGTYTLSRRYIATEWYVILSHIISNPFSVPGNPMTLFMCKSSIALSPQFYFSPLSTIYFHSFLAHLVPSFVFCSPMLFSVFLSLSLSFLSSDPPPLPLYFTSLLQNIYHLIPMREERQIYISDTLLLLVPAIYVKQQLILDQA